MPLIEKQSALGALTKSAIAGVGGASLVYLAANFDWGKRGPYLESPPEMRELLFNSVALGGAAFIVMFALGRIEPVKSAAEIEEARRASRLRVSGPMTLTDVFHAQFNLLKLGYPVEPTGTMDAKTRQALKSFQATYSLQLADGTVNPETLAYLDALVKQSAQLPDPTTGLHRGPVSFT